jgi:hypothetical protein
VPADGGTQQSSGAWDAQQATTGFLHRGEVWYAAQSDGAAQVGEILQEGGQAPIVGLEEDFEDQTDEQLGLRV